MTQRGYFYTRRPAIGLICTLVVFKDKVGSALAALAWLPAQVIDLSFGTEHDVNGTSVGFPYACTTLQRRRQDV